MKAPNPNYAKNVLRANMKNVFENKRTDDDEYRSDDQQS